jgi:uncharacterized protein (DUF2147 family)
MKRLLVAAALALTGTAGYAADPVMGTWTTPPDDGYYVVKFQQCGSTICGIIQDRVDGAGKSTGKNKGKKMVLELQSTGNGKYSGKVWHPSKDKVFSGKGALNGNKLEMSGCVLGGLICQSSTWTRVN